MKFCRMLFDIDKDGKDEIKIELCDSDLKIANSIILFSWGPTVISSNTLSGLFISHTALYMTMGKHYHCFRTFSFHLEANGIIFSDIYNFSQFINAFQITPSIYFFKMKASLIFLALLLALASSLKTYEKQISAQRYSSDVYSAYSVGSLNAGDIVVLEISFPSPTGSSPRAFRYSLEKEPFQSPSPNGAQESIPPSKNPITSSIQIDASGTYSLVVTPLNSVDSIQMFYLDITVNGVKKQSIMDMPRKNSYTVFYVNAPKTVTIVWNYGVLDVWAMNPNNKFVQSHSVSGVANSQYMMLNLEKGYYVIKPPFYPQGIAWTLFYQSDVFPCPYSKTYKDEGRLFQACSSLCTPPKEVEVNGNCECAFDYIKIQGTCSCRSGEGPTGKCFCPGGKILGSSGDCVCPPNEFLGPDGRCACLPPQTRNDQGACTCPAGMSLVNGQCTCSAGKEFVNGKCSCPKDQEVGKTGECVCSGTGQKPQNGSCQPLTQCPLGFDQRSDGLCVCDPYKQTGKIIINGQCVCPPKTKFNSIVGKCV